jgi:hypothetical protein
VILSFKANFACRIAVQLSPHDPEIAFNLAAVLEACKSVQPGRLYQLTSIECLGGQLEESLKYYSSSKDNGVERAAVHIRNVCNAM